MKSFYKNKAALSAYKNVQVPVCLQMCIYVAYAIIIIPFSQDTGERIT